MTPTYLSGGKQEDTLPGKIFKVIFWRLPLTTESILSSKNSSWSSSDKDKYQEEKVSYKLINGIFK